MKIAFSQLKRLLEESTDNDAVRVECLSEANDKRLGRKARWTRKQKKKRDKKMLAAGQKGRIAIPGIQNQPTTSPSKAKQHRRPPQVDPNARQKLAELAQSISQNGHLSQEDFLRKLADAFGRKWSDIEKSKYFSNTNTGDELTLRLSNHRGNAESFKRWNELKGNFGIVVKMKDQDFIPDDEVEYVEEVFFWDDLGSDIQIGIVNGLADWVAHGAYTGPQGNQTFLSPGNGRPSRTRAPKNQQERQVQPDDAPHDGKEVKESLYKHHKESKTMRKRISESTKITLTLRQLKKLVRESMSDIKDFQDIRKGDVGDYNGEKWVIMDKGTSMEMVDKRDFEGDLQNLLDTGKISKDWRQAVYAINDNGEAAILKYGEDGMTVSRDFSHISSDFVEDVYDTDYDALQPISVGVLNNMLTPNEEETLLLTAWHWFKRKPKEIQDLLLTGDKVTANEFVSNLWEKIIGVKPETYEIKTVAPLILRRLRRRVERGVDVLRKDMHF